MRSPSLAIAALTLLAGHFAPWAAHKTAALTLSAHELSVFTNFTPNAGVFPNEGFLLPLWGAGLLLALHAQGARGLGRAGWLTLALGVVALGLPGYPELRKLLTGQGSAFLPQTLLTPLIGALVLACARFLKLRLPVIAGVCLATGVTLIGYAVIRGSALEALYHDPLGFGWGWWASAIAASGLAAGNLARKFVRISP